MIHFDFVVTDEEANTIFECLSDMIDKTEQERIEMSLSTSTDQQTRNHIAAQVAWYERHVRYLRNLTKKMKNCKLSGGEVVDLAMKCSQQNKAADIIFESGIDFDDSENHMKFVEEMLRAADLKEMSVTLMISLLTCSNIYHDKMPYRKEFFNAVREEIISREGDSRIKSLLGGLEGKDGGARAREAFDFIKKVIR